MEDVKQCSGTVRRVSKRILLPERLISLSTAGQIKTDNENVNNCYRLELGSSREWNSSGMKNKQRFESNWIMNHKQQQHDFLIVGTWKMVTKCIRPVKKTHPNCAPFAELLPLCKRAEPTLCSSKLGKLQLDKVPLWANQSVRGKREKVGVSIAQSSNQALNVTKSRFHLLFELSTRHVLGHFLSNSPK